MYEDRRTVEKLLVYSGSMCDHNVPCKRLPPRSYITANEAAGALLVPQKLLGLLLLLQRAVSHGSRET